MRDRIIDALETFALVCEHRMFGLMVWVLIAVLQIYDAKWAVASVAGLMIFKTYLSGTWTRKGLNGNDKNGNGTVPAVGSGVHVSEHKSTGNPV